MTIHATPDALSDNAPPVECVVAPPVVAAVAAHAAGAVSGVVRLEPRLTGLVTSLLRSARQRVKGLDPAPTDGVQCDIVEGRARLEINLVTSGQDQAIAVAQRVQRAVAHAVTDATGLPVTEVAVCILDIEAVPR
jgi:uncharacterized alkaline shock family protein YloU